jgi:inorganic pyrophosphatase/exopolyphosphatase
VSISDLICFDEIVNLHHITEEFLSQKFLRLTLCDHNALAAHLESQYGSTVVEIIDHHADRDFYPWVLAPHCRNIAFAKNKPTAMSTCTLIAELFVTAQEIESDKSGDGDNDNDGRDIVSAVLTEDVATLLLAVIAVDSGNLSNATIRDMEIVTVRMEQTIQWHNST